jgi:MFS family permease
MFTLRRYRELFQVGEVPATLLASVPGRLPIGMAGLAILLFVQGKSGSFVHAGTAAALYVLGLALVAPGLGRLIDRLGPRPVLTACSIVYPAALVVLTASVTYGAGRAWIAASALVAGAALPPITICVRALFPRVLRDAALLQTAYSVDSALIESIFILGPALVAGFVAAGYPEGAVLLAALAAATGTATFLRAPAVKRWQRRATAQPAGVLGPLRQHRMLVVLAATTLYSLAFGLFEVAVTAYAAGRSAPWIAGVALALASVGSATGAIVYGSRAWRPPLGLQFRIALMCMAAGILLLAPVSNLYLFMVGSVVAGVPMATVIAVQSLLISRFSPRDMLAESFTWGTTCLLGGVSAGIAIGGMMAEYLSPSWIFFGAGSATLVAAAAAGVKSGDDGAERS